MFRLKMRPVTRLVSQLPGAAVTKCRKPRGWKRERCALSLSWSLEVHSQGVGRVTCFCEGLGRAPRLLSSWAHRLLGTRARGSVTWLLVASPLRVGVSPPCLTRTLSFRFGAPLDNPLRSLTWAHLHRPFLQARACLQVLGVRMWTSLFEGVPIYPTADR